MMTRTDLRTTSQLQNSNSSFIPNQSGCVLTHLQPNWLCLSNQSSKSLLRLSWAITINQYASNLIIGFRPNRLNSLSMIVLTSSALSGVVMIES